MAYILIAYLWAGSGPYGNHGGPLAVRFADREACEAAIVEMRKPAPSNAGFIGRAICVPEGSGDARP